MLLIIRWIPICYIQIMTICVLKGKKFDVLSAVQKNRAVTRGLVAWVTPD